MKTVKSLKTIVVLIMILVMNGCSSTNSPQDVASKIENNEELTKQDYDIMMDYIDDNLKSFVENAKEDQDAALNDLRDWKDDKLLVIFDKKIPGYSEAVFTSLLCGGDGNIDRTEFYPKSIMMEGSAQVLEDFNLSDKPIHLSLACIVNGKDYFITPDQWSKMSNDQKSMVIKRGIVVMKNGEAFVISDFQIGKGGVGNISKPTRAHLPSKKQAEIIVKDMTQFINNIETFGLPEFKGSYLTRDVIKKTEPTEYYSFSAARGISTIQATHGNQANLCSIKPLYKNATEDFSFDNLSSDKAQYSLEINKEGKLYYIPISEFWKIPESEYSFKFMGIRVNKEGVDVVIDLLKLRGGDEINSDAVIENYYNDLPTQQEAEVIRKNIEEIDNLIANFGGDPLGGGYTKSYFMRTKSQSLDTGDAASSPYQFGGNVEFREYDGLITFVELSHSNKSYVRKVWAPHGKIKSERIDSGQSEIDDEEVIETSYNPSDYDYAYTGSIDDFPIELYYSYDLEDGEGVLLFGFYKYLKNGTVLDLNGKEKKNGEVILNEFTKDGVNSGEFRLSLDASKSLSGTFINKTNGKTYQVKLKSVK